MGRVGFILILLYGRMANNFRFTHKNYINCNDEFLNIWIQLET